jgi:hypothetical protein
MKKVINVCFPAPLDPGFRPAIVFQNRYLAAATNPGVERFSSLGDDVLIARAQAVLKVTFSSVAGRIELAVSDERSRRVG